MPQKVNPDALELIRGKSARVMGNLQTLMLLVKNLPMAYNRDLQEDKPPLFDSFDTVSAQLELAEPIVSGSELDREAINDRLERGYLDATTLMEWMIQRGVPQRRAHHLVGAIVGEAMRRGIPLADLPLDVMQSHASEIDEGVYDSLGTKNAVAAFVSYGSTAPDQVRAQIDRWTKILSGTSPKTIGDQHPG
jgi:argininosuccinate lyase